MFASADPAPAAWSTSAKCSPAVGAARVAELGLALASLKHSVPGDMALFGRADVEDFPGKGADVTR